MDRTLVEVIQRHAQATPAAVALVFLDANLVETHSLTFQQLDEAARQVAVSLAARYAPGDRAGLLLSGGAEFVTTFLGCLYAGVIAVPLFPLQSRRETYRNKVAAILRDADCAVLMSDIEHAAETEEWLRQIALPGSPGLLSPTSGGDTQAWRAPTLASSDIAFLQYTSGSTGAPKGACVTHENLIANEQLLARCLGHSRQTVIATWLPLHHDMGLIGNVLQSLYLGVRAIVMTPMSFLSRPVGWLEAISRYRVTSSGAPNFAYAQCVAKIREAQLDGLDLSSWDVAYSGAEPIRADTIEAFERKFRVCGLRREALYTCYGLAEATLIVTGSRRGEYPTILDFDSAQLSQGRVEVVHRPGPGVQRLVSCGYVAAGQPIAIVDPVRHVQCTSAEIGEIWTKGPCTTAGYWRNESATAKTFVNFLSPASDGPYLRTGDLGFVHDGQLYVTGRMTDTVIVRGRKYAPQDLELTAQRNCASLQPDAGAVFTVEAEGAERLVLVHELARSALRELQASDVFRSIARAIAAEHGLRVHEIVLIKPGTLPKTTSGKVQRQRTKTLLASNELAIVEKWSHSEGTRSALLTTEFVPARSELQQSLIGVWAEVLQISEQDIGIHHNFFDLGGDSVSLLQLQRRVAEATGASISAVDLFSCSSIALLASHLMASGSTAQRPALGLQSSSPATIGSDIAVIGMSGRFPDAASVDELWENLRAGKCSVRLFSEEQMLAAGTRPDLLKRDNYVRAGVILDDIDLFDASYFGLTLREAEAMDPQQRLLMECAVEALESAGYAHEEYCGPIGVFVGRGEGYYSHRLLSRLDYRESISTLISTLIGTSPSYAATLISYHLNLTGPSLTMQTACSTSLVAVHQARQALLAGECEIALVGGANIDVFQHSGYTYEEGSIASPDGYCRAFSADAQGTVCGSGVGLVVLRRLDRARAAGDTIHAVIKSSAINNDGARKPGYSAPSVAGQVEVIRRALNLAQVPADTISYVEAHGTSTALGDPIEVAALTQAFGNSGKRTERCAIGSLKTNIGHLDVAAGVSGLIKVIQSLKHKEIPPSLNFTGPNPEIVFDNTPFVVNAQLRAWPETSLPRRAAVSAFGVGGTNAHVIVEEATSTAAIDRAPRNRLFVLSAASTESLRKLADRLADHLERQPDTDLADVAHTLQVGRRALRHRAFAVSDTRERLVGKLRSFESLSLATALPGHSCLTAFMFPGQGSQYAGMGQGLYRVNAIFRDTLDSCASILKPMLRVDIRSVIFAASESLEGAALNRTALTQPALFAVEYCLAQMWRSFGIVPCSMLGHSVGEYVAACIAGVFSLEDALATIAARGELMDDTEPGAMLAVPMGEGDVIALLAGSDCDLAAVNGSLQCVVSGAGAAIEEIQRRLRTMGIEGRLLPALRGFHSRTMESVLDRYAASLGRVRLHAPTIPFISNLTGHWITAEQAQDPGYWLAHLRGTVRFADGLQKLSHSSPDVLLEVGPGKTLVSLARKHRELGRQAAVSTLLPHIDETSSLLEAIGELWKKGTRIEWSGLGFESDLRRVPLPSYPFTRQKYWLPERRTSLDAPKPVPGKLGDIGDWFHIPGWRLQPRAATACRPEGERTKWLVFSAGNRLCGSFIDVLRRTGPGSVTTVVRGDAFTQSSAGEFAINPNDEDDYYSLIAALQLEPDESLEIVHLWNVSEQPAPDSVTVQSFIEAQSLGFISLCHLVRALSKANSRSSIRLTAIGTGLCDVTGREILRPERAAVASICKVIPQEERHFICKVVDVVAPPPQASVDDVATVAAEIHAELQVEQPGSVVAYRGRSRWVQTYDKVTFGESRPGRAAGEAVKHGGVYAITGGLGNIGCEFAVLLAERYAAKLILIGRSKLPERGAWSTWLSQYGESDPVSRKIRRLQRLEALGADFLLFDCDVTDLDALRAMWSRAEERYGHVDGIIHTATDMSNLFVQLQDLSPYAYLKQCHAKVNGLIVLREIVRSQRVGLLIVTSSLSAVLGGMGLAAYAASNAFADAFTERMSREDGTTCIAVNWDAWSFPGEDSYATHELGELHLSTPTDVSMTAQEGVAAFDRILANGPSPRVVVSVTELQPRLRKWIEISDVASASRVDDDKATQSAMSSAPRRREVATPYVAPSDEIERELVGVLRDLLGPDAGMNDSFFDLGGDSLVATQFIARVRARFGVGIAIREFYVNPTLATVAEKVRAGRRVSMLLADDESSAGQVEEL